jgi:hypothetical protein
MQPAVVRTFTSLAADPDALRHAVARDTAAA